MMYLFGLSIACFLFLLGVLKKDKQTPDFILMTWMGFTAFHLTVFYFQYSGLSYQYPHTLGLQFPLPLLHGVFLYGYVRELTRNSILKMPLLLVHLVPFASLVVLAVPFFSLSGAQKVEVFRQEGRGFEWYSLIQLGLILLSGFSYCLATLVAIYKHRHRIYRQFSNSDRKMLQWLEYLTFGLGIIWMVALFFDEAVIFACVVLFVLFIGFFGIQQVPIFYSIPVVAPDLPAASVEVAAVTADLPVAETGVTSGAGTDPNPEKYAKTGLKEEGASQIMDRLEARMKTEKPFANSDLTLNDLARQLDVTPHQLSQAINSRNEKTFYHYVNTYRIEEFLTLAALPENRKYTFLALAFDCGFNSKTTFNKYFKLHTGKTPSEYFDSALTPAS